MAGFVDQQDTQVSDQAYNRYERPPESAQEDRNSNEEYGPVNIQVYSLDANHPCESPQFLQAPYENSCHNAGQFLMLSPDRVRTWLKTKLRSRLATIARHSQANRYMPITLVII